jgi:hypothetical protein
VAGSSSGSDGSSNPGDINDRLAEIAAELAAEAKFKEPSAAERARAAARRGAPRQGSPGQATSGHSTSGHSTPGHSKQSRGGPLRQRRNKRLADELRQPVLAPGQKAPPRPPKAPKAPRRPWQQGGTPVPDRGYATPTRRRGGARSVISIVLVLAVLAGLSFGLRRLLHSGTPAPAASAATSGSPRIGARPSPSPSVTPLFTTANPFAGSPAANYANGAAGIVLPAAHEVGPYTRAQVAAAYVVVKNLLVAAMLNRPTMDGAKPTALGRQLISQQRSWFYQHLTRPIKSRHRAPWLSRLWVTAFASGTKVVGAIVKVHGNPMTATVDTYDQSQALEIKADYIFVYAVQQPNVAASRMRIVAQQYVTVQFAPWDDPGGSLEPWVSDFGASYAGAQCGETDGFVHPAFPALGPGTVAPSGAPVNPYQLAPPSKGACERVTGT